MDIRPVHKSSADAFAEPFLDTFTSLLSRESHHNVAESCCLYSSIFKAHSVSVNWSLHSLAQLRTAKVIWTTEHYVLLFPASTHHSRERQAYECNTGHVCNDTNSTAPQPIWNIDWELSNYTETTPPVAWPSRNTTSCRDRHGPRWGAPCSTDSM